jgi:inhibitor of cysteine peptidase
VSLSTGDTLTIDLEGNPTTGYLWVFGAPFDSSLLLMTAESYTKPDLAKGKTGAPVRKIMTFKAMAPGRTGLKLDYRRPWERSEKPIKTFEILVNITGKPVEEPPEPEDTPRVGSNGKIAKDPSKELLGE